MKERLIELLDKKQVCGWKYVVDDYTTDVLNEDIADYLLANGVVVVDTNKVSAKNLPLITHIAGYPINEVIDLMEAKNAGRIVELPCAVGDTVYVMYRHPIALSCIIAEDISKIGITTKQFLGENTYDFNQFGKTVFLTKEEAEKALERSGGK